MKLLVSAVVPLVAACGLAAHVPAESKGNTRVVVSNGLDAKICSFAMTPRDAAKPSQNWLGSLGIAPGNGQNLDVKPGDYYLYLGGCNDQFKAERAVRITRPTLITIGTDNYDRPREWAVVRLRPVGQVGFLQRDQGGGGGESAPSEESAPADSGAPAEQPAEKPKSDCLPPGTKTENYHRCCSEAAKSQIEASENIFTCA